MNLSLGRTISRAVDQITEIARRRSLDTEVFVRRGAIKIAPQHLAFWIATKTDDERDRLRSDPDLLPELHKALIDAGYPSESVRLVHFLVESQETVDREYGGSWSEAMEMP